MSHSEPRHPIRVVARRTGLTAELIRAWEFRYGVIAPARTGSGRRLYTDAQIEHLQLLRLAVQGGRSIGQVAGQGPDELRALVAGDAAAPGVTAPAGSAVIAGAERLLEEAVDAVRRFDGLALETLLRSAAIAWTQSQLIERVLVPLMRRVGDAWHQGTLSVAHEHLATAVVRSVIATLPRPGGLAPNAPAVVVATPAGQLHELGALMVAAAAAGDGWRVVYLGANTPAGDIVRAVRDAGAGLVALSVTVPGETAAVERELRAVRSALPGTALVAGGQAVGEWRAVLNDIGATMLPDTAALQGHLAELSRAAA